MEGSHRSAGLRSTLTVAIALGANLGDPDATLMAVRPLLERRVSDWCHPVRRCRWSPLFRTEPVGGPPGQPPYRNAVLVVEALSRLPDPLPLLQGMQSLESAFGRQREVRWGPRSLDLDLLWCGDLQLSTAELELPHPRLLERTFVIAPLVSIEPTLVPPGAAASVQALLEVLLAHPGESAPQTLPARPGWPEGPPPPPDGVGVTAGMDR